MSPPPSSFTAKKAHILSLLSVPATEYDDLSPKGSIDVGIRDLIDEINALPGLVTTSSCAGRVSVFLEGRKNGEGKEGDEVESGGGGGLVRRETKAGVGGKGGGGRWLFVSHDPVSVDEEGEEDWAGKMGMCRLDGEVQEKIDGETRLIHFKFEPMILHILTASLQQAQLVLSAALQSGFRESGALNLTTSTQQESATPMVGIRSMGLSLESVVGYHVEDGKNEEGKQVCMIPEWQLRHLVVVANQRFVENTKRIERFRALLKECMAGGNEMGDTGKWESVEERKERKRAEGLRRAREVKDVSVQEVGEGVPDLSALELNL